MPNRRFRGADAARFPAPPPPGIYQMAGTMQGQECWIAYDEVGECCIARGVGAYQELELWLRDRGVHLPSSAPLLFLAWLRRDAFSDLTQRGLR
jgi:hypothetical protein